MRSIALLFLLCLSIHGQTNVTIGTANVGGGDPLGTAFAKLNYFDNWLKTNTPKTLANYGGIAGDSLTDDVALAAFSASTDGELVVSTGTWNINTNATIATTKALRFQKGGIISVASGVTLTLNCAVSAGNWQIFSGSGTVVCGSDAPIPFLNVCWFGALESSSRSDDNVTAFNKAIAAIAPMASRGGFVYVPAGNYWFDSGMTVSGHLDIRGDGFESTILRADFSTSGTLLAVPGNAEARLWNLQLLNDTASTSTNNGLSIGVSTLSGSKLEMQNVKLAQWTANALAFTNLNYGRVFNCFFQNNKNDTSIFGTGGAQIARAVFSGGVSTVGGGTNYVNGVYFSQCRFSGNDQTVFAQYGSSFNFENCTIEGEGSRLTTTAPSNFAIGGTAFSAFKFTGNYVEGNYCATNEAFLKLDSVRGAQITGNLFANHLSSSMRGHITVLITNDSIGLQIGGNIFSGARDHFIRNYGGDMVWAPGNSYETHTGTKLTNWVQISPYLTTNNIAFSTGNEGLCLAKINGVAP